MPLVPTPVPPELVRHDTSSLQGLRAAASAFRDLASIAEDADRRLRLRLWHLAALANDPDTVAEARSLAEAWLAEPALFGPAVLWFVERQLIADVGATIERALAPLRPRSDDAAVPGGPDIISSLHLLLALGRLKDAREILGSHRSLLEAENPNAPAFFLAHIL